jgi:hypothetical protein
MFLTAISKAASTVSRAGSGHQRKHGGAARCVFLLCFIVAGTVALSAETAPGAARDYASATIKLVVYGPSDDIFIWWGHAAIIVEEPNGTAFTFDWGVFDYPGDNFLAAFFQGKVRYRSAKTSTRSDMKTYFDEDRDIVVYTLDLDDASKERIIRYAEENVLPENCWYAYDDFKDNCSTRIRDVIDRGTAGQLRAWAENEKGRFTLRQHVRRFMAFHPWVDWYAGFLIGRTLDREISAWDEMFLPIELGRHISDFSFLDADGITRKLVSHVTLLNQTKTRQPILISPPSILARSFCAGVLIALFFIIAVHTGKRHPKTSRIAAGILQSALGLFFGLSGCVIILAPVLAGNEYLAHNNNLLFINPLFTAAVPLGIISAAGKNIRLGKKKIPVEKALRILWAYMLYAALAAELLNVLPRFRQENASIIMFILPIALALVCGGRIPRFCRRR